MANVPAKMYGI